MMDSLVMGARELIGFHANLAVQTVVWVLLWTLGLRMLRVRAGALQHAAWLIVLGVIPLFPLVGGQSSRVVGVTDVAPVFRMLRIMPALNVQSVPTAYRPDSQEEFRPSSAEAEGTGTKRPAGVSSEGERRSVSDLIASLPRPSIFAFSGSIWLMGIVAMLFRMMSSYRALLRMRRDAKEVGDPRLLSLLEGLTKEIGVGRSVRLEESDDIPSPISYGVHRPVILLPSSLIDSMSLSEMRWVLAHELAHIRRLDFVVTLFQRMLEAFFFYHPLVWFASSRLTLNREHACDDWVVNLGSDRKEYAMSLLGFMQPRDVPEARFVSALFGRPGKLARRITTITNTRRNVVPSASRRAVVVTALIAIVGLLWIGSFSCVGRRNVVTQPAPEVKELLDQAERLRRDVYTTQTTQEQILALIEDALVQAEKLPAERARKIARMHALSAKARYAYFSMAWTEWMQLYEQALALARELGDKPIATRMRALRTKLGSFEAYPPSGFLVASGTLDCGDLDKDMPIPYRKAPALLSKSVLLKEEYTEAEQAFRQARESFLESKCHSGIAVCDAALGFIDHVDPEWPRYPVMSTGWLCYAFQRENDVYTYAGWSGYRIERRPEEGERKFWIMEAYPDIGRKLGDAFRRLGDTWEYDTSSYGRYPHPLRTTGALVSDHETVTVPAGTFIGCRKVRVETRQTEQTLAAVPRIVGMNRSKCGIEEAWYAPGVGMIKFRVEREDGARITAVLKEYDVEGKEQGYLPLHIGNRWVYVWEGVDGQEYAAEQVLQVHSRDDSGTHYLSHYYYAYRIGESRTRSG